MFDLKNHMMKITNEILLDAIHCSYKVFKKTHDQSVPCQTEIDLLYKSLKDEHNRKFNHRFIGRAGLSFSFNVTFQNDRVAITFDALEKTTERTVVPILTVPFERISKADKIFLALQAHLACQEFSLKVDRCKIIYGEDFRTLLFKLSTLKKEIDKIFTNLRRTITNSIPPVFYKNNHCQFCEFYSECMNALRQRDDLSLLAGMKPQEIQKRNSRGIFSVRQLSFTFRAKRNPYRTRKFSPELKALAIRNDKTYVKENWNVPRSDVEVFLDIEGIPNSNLNYLVGLVIRTKDSEDVFSFWADDKKEEKKIFELLVNTLSKYGEFAIYHYGSYENQVLKNISKTFPDQLSFIDKMLENSFNILSLLAEYIYPPTYSNGLKEVARFLGFEWTDKNASGLQSIIWRCNWEKSRDETLKERLLRYNIEDCKALMKVFDWICAVSEPTRKSEFLPEPKQDDNHKWGKTDYAFTDFGQINSKAYFDYQRNHIVVRSGKKKIVCRPRRIKNLKDLNKALRNNSLFPKKCPQCESLDLSKLHVSEKVHLDLMFMKTGLKAFITKYSGGPFLCNQCKGKFKGGDMRSFPKYGKNLMIWSVNQKIQYQLSSESVINFLRDSVKIDVSPTQMTRFKEVVAQMYQKTYQEIIERMVHSNLIHADETIARIKGIDGYVWVFANHECVYYEFRETRETHFLKDLLTPFKGTLVTDFYSGYDSIECKQQKCLVHLIRDMNEDYLKNQFDVELKIVVTEFGKLLSKIVATIDRYGLRKFHLNKHRNDVKTFYAKFVDVNYESEVTQNYKRRLTRYKDKIFQFLEEDNIPWNNNNAEHSIKPFAKWRKQKSSNLSVDNITNHLVLLSILQTCKYKGINFFEFMKSGELSVFKFLGN